MNSKVQHRENTMKVVVVGDEYSGKTTLINALLGKAYVEPLPTQLIDFQTKTLQNEQKTLKIRFWDTPRQFTLHTPTPYYRGANVVLYVVDSTVPFDSQKGNEWLRLISRDNPRPNLPLFVVGTKCDDKTDERPDIQKFIAVQKLKYYEVSAKSNVGIVELFNQIVLAGSVKVDDSGVKIVEPGNEKQKEKCF
ncbi:Uncharacterized protein QTN25_004983 [Entamoeba marina]